MEFSTLLSLYLTIFLSTSLLLLFYTRRRNLRLPPGNFTLPFIGETLQLISAYKTENPEPFIDERVNRFGPIFTTHVFGEPTVFSTDPETNRFIFQNEDKFFESSYPSSVESLIGKYSLLTMTGSLHKRMRSLTMTLANPALIRDHLIGDMDRLIRINLDSWPSHVFLLQEAKKISFALTIKQQLSFDPCDWTETLRKEFFLVINGFFSVPLPFFSSTYNKAIKARGKLMEALRSVVRKRREENARGERNNDFLQTLLDEESEGGRFTDDQIADFMIGILSAGFDTTSTTITLAVKFLTETPLALAQLKDEHEKIKAEKGANGTLTWSDYKAMSFTHCVLNETLRIANVIGGIFRRVKTDVDVKGYTIPKGWKVFASFRGVHMNDDHFKDARTFNPWRWQHDKGATNPTSVFMPFGGGARMCPGFELAKVTISVFLHYFVTQFSWEPAEEDRLLFFPTTRTQKGYPIHVKRNKAGM